MNSSALKRKTLARLITAVAVAVPIIFTACAGGVVAPNDTSTSKQSSSSTLSVSSVTPISGPAAGGTTVTIHGADFLSGVSVTFGGLAASSVRLSDSSTIVAVAPAHDSGSVDVTVTNSDGESASLPSGFAFHSIDLLWNPPSSTPVAVAGYNVYRGNSSAGPFGRLNGATIPATSFIDATVLGATTYYYEVRSVDVNGTESAPAGPVPATTTP